MYTKGNYAHIESIFQESDIEEIYNNSNPISHVFELIENQYKSKSARVDYDSNMLMSIAEFHVSNLIYLKENFKFPNTINCKLLNLLNILLSLREDDLVLTRNITSMTYDNMLSTNNIKKKTQTNSIMPLIIEEQEKNNLKPPEPDFAEIVLNKLTEIKAGLITLNLVHPKKQDHLSVTGNNFYLNRNEIAEFLEYIKTFYFPFIKLYYHFINIEKITENRKIDVIISRPLPIPALCLAVAQIQEKNQFEEQKEEKADETKRNVNYFYF
jgi:hypothetical protein